MEYGYVDTCWLYALFITYNQYTFYSLCCFILKSQHVVNNNHDLEFDIHMLLLVI